MPQTAINYLHQLENIKMRLLKVKVLFLIKECRKKSMSLFQWNIAQMYHDWLLYLSVCYKYRTYNQYRNPEKSNRLTEFISVHVSYSGSLVQKCDPLLIFPDVFCLTKFTHTFSSMQRLLAYQRWRKWWMQTFRFNGLDLDQTHQTKISLENSFGMKSSVKCHF